MKTAEPFDPRVARILCSGECDAEHGCGVNVPKSMLESGAWEHAVLDAHWSVLTHGRHEHKEVFCSISCIAYWATHMLVEHEPQKGFPIGDEPIVQLPNPPEAN